MVYDERDDVFILFGGWTETSEGTYHRLGDTWAFYLSNQTWVQRNPSLSPSPRSDSLVAYDSIDGVALLFGGFDGSSYLGDTWYYTFKTDTWTQLRSAVSPPPRADGRMVYDTRERLFFAFGGNDFSGPNFTFHHLGDTWAYDWNTNLWRQIATDSAPSPRDYPILAYDANSAEILLFGGYGNYSFFGDVWAFNATALTWSNISTPEGPDPRFAAVGGYDSNIGALVIFGGGYGSRALADTWFFRYPPPLFAGLVTSSTDAVVGQEIAFVATLQGGSGTLEKETWFFGDGSDTRGLEGRHTFRWPGMYRVRFEAQDDHGHNLEIVSLVTVGILIPLWANFLAFGAGISALVIVFVKTRSTRPRDSQGPASPSHLEKRPHRNRRGWS